jgi:hypothetical protein
MNRVLFVGGGEKSSSTLSLSSSIAAGASSLVNQSTSGSVTAVPPGLVESAVDDIVGGRSNEAFALDDHPSTYRRTHDVDVDYELHASRPPSSRRSTPTAIPYPDGEPTPPATAAEQVTAKHQHDDDAASVRPDHNVRQDGSILRGFPKRVTSEISITLQWQPRFFLVRC